MGVTGSVDGVRGDPGDGLRAEELVGVVGAALVGHQILLHRGRDAARMDRGDTQGRFIGAKGSGEPAQRELARRIGRQPGGRVDTRPGVDEHHVPLGRTQRGQQLQGQCHRADDVDGHRGAPLVHRGLSDPAGVGHPGVVDEHVELDDRFHDRGQRVRVGEIHRPCGGAEALGDGIEAGGGAAGEQQRVGGGQRIGQGGAQSAGGPGDHGGRHETNLTDLRGGRTRRMMKGDAPRSQLHAHAARGPRGLSVEGQ